MGILDGRTAIITGAAGGIGRACARRFAEEGASLVLADISADGLAKVEEELASAGGSVVTIVCDVAHEDQIDEVVHTALREFGHIDILANIAQGAMGDMVFLDATSTSQALESYVTGPLQSMLFMQKCLPHMKAQNYGRIINTASHSALRGEPGFAAYVMAKGAVMALTRSASQEWGRYGIVTNTFLPVIRTPAYDLTEQGRAAAKMVEAQNPSGRFGTAYEDCSPVIAFLASEGAGYLNGQAIGIDGGQTLIA
nr:SDR family oxidoreductase [Mycobacterium kyogaense]